MYKFIDEKNEHLHTLNEKPLIGTSSVCNVLAKNLTWWAAETSAVECLEVGEKIPTIREEYLEACASTDKKKAIDALQVKYPIFKKARFAHFADKNSKAKKGTDLHAELEKFVKSEMGIEPCDIATLDLKIVPFVEWAKKNVKRFLWSEMHCYSEKLWLGGITDCGFEDNEGKYAILDFKSAKDAYLSQFWQCAGYDLQIAENGGFDKDGKKVFELDKPISYYAVLPFGMEKPEVKFYYDVEGGRSAFEAMLLLYKKLN